MTHENKKVLERKEKPTAIVNCPHCGSKLEIEKGDIWWHKDIDGGNYQVYLSEVKPYLRSLSSMTVEEFKEWLEYCKADYDCEFQPEPTFDFESCILSINWLNAHHFDYRGLIEKGLAISVTKENNPYKE